MRRLLLAGAALAALGFPEARAAETATYCGPASGMTCETQTDFMVFGQAAKDVTVAFGNIGSQTGLPIMKMTSDGGLLNVFFDIANGFATITPAHGQTTFNGLDFSIPGFGFTQLVFDEQLTPTGPTESFTITGHFGSTTVLPVGNETDAPDTDKEFSITASGGVFTDVNIDSLTGFDEIKHIEVAGVCQLQSNGSCTPVVISAPEPGSLAVLGTGLLGLGWILRRCGPNRRV